MLFLLIFPVLVAGFLACHIHPVYSYKLHRYEGQYLYLKSAELGLKCFVIAFVLALALHYWMPDIVSIGDHSVSLALSLSLAAAMKVIGAEAESEASKMAWFFILSALTLIAAVLLKMKLLLRTSTSHSGRRPSSQLPSSTLMLIRSGIHQERPFQYMRRLSILLIVTGYFAKP